VWHVHQQLCTQLGVRAALTCYVPASALDIAHIWFPAVQNFHQGSGHHSFHCSTSSTGVRGWGTSLWIGRCRVRFPMGSFKIFHRLNTSGRTVDLRSTQPLTEMSTRNLSCRVKVGRASNIATFMCRLKILEAITSWSSQGLSKPVQVQVYL
jgi:hypothetical protein